MIPGSLSAIMLRPPLGTLDVFSHQKPLVSLLQGIRDWFVDTYLFYIKMILPRAGHLQEDLPSLG